MVFSSPFYWIKVFTFLFIGRPIRWYFFTHGLFSAYHLKIRIEMSIYHDIYSTQKTIHSILYSCFICFIYQNPVLEFSSCYCREENSLNVIFPFFLFHSLPYLIAKLSISMDKRCPTHKKKRNFSCKYCI